MSGLTRPSTLAHASVALLLLSACTGTLDATPPSAPSDMPEPTRRTVDPPTPAPTTPAAQPTPPTYDELLAAIAAPTSIPESFWFGEECPTVADACWDGSGNRRNASRTWRSHPHEGSDGPWLSPMIYLTISQAESPEEAAAEAAAALTPTPEYYAASFDTAAVARDDPPGSYTPGYRGTGALNDVRFAGWAGQLGHSRHVLVSPTGTTSPEYDEAFLAVASGNLRFTCTTYDLAEGEMGSDLCGALAAEILGP